MKNTLAVLEEVLNNPDAKWEDVVNWKVHYEKELREIQKKQREVAPLMRKTFACIEELLGEEAS